MANNKSWKWLCALGAVFVPTALLADVNIPHTFTPGAVIRSAEVNANFDALKTSVDTLEATVTGKADTAAVDTLAKTVLGKADSAAVDTLAKTVLGKADSAAVDALAATVASKADNASVDALETTVAGKADKPASGAYVSTPAGRMAYAWVDGNCSVNPAPNCLLAAGYAYNPAGPPPTSSRSSAGNYIITFPGLTGGASGGHVQVTAYGGGNAQCKVESWGAPSAAVRCFNVTGVAVDSMFTIMFLL